jgi:hypothetical protein
VDDDVRQSRIFPIQSQPLPKEQKTESKKQKNRHKQHHLSYFLFQISYLPSPFMVQAANERFLPLCHTLHPACKTAFFGTTLKSLVSSRFARSDQIFPMKNYSSRADNSSRRNPNLPSPLRTRINLSLKSAIRVGTILHSVNAAAAGAA